MILTYIWQLPADPAKFEFEGILIIISILFLFMSGVRLFSPLFQGTKYMSPLHIALVQFWPAHGHFGTG